LSRDGSAFHDLAAIAICDHGCRIPGPVMRDAHHSHRDSTLVPW